MAFSWGQNLRGWKEPICNVIVEDVDKKFPSKGKGTFANRALTPRDVIFEVAEPLTAALDTHELLKTCYNCYSRPESPVEAHLGNGGSSSELEPESKPLMVCTGCRTVRYCKAECQRASWRSIHKHECKLFAETSSQPFISPRRAIISLLIQKRTGKISDTAWKELMECPSHVDKFKDPRYPHLNGMLGLAYTTKMLIATDEITMDIFELCCLLKINAVSLMTPWMDSLGIMLDTQIAKINHSCRPNAYVRAPLVRKNGYVQVVPLRDIQMGEEITIPYIDETYPYRLRQKELQERYFFTCRCDKCEKKKHNLSIGDEMIFYQRGLATQQALEEKVMGYVETANKSGDLLIKINNLRYAMHLLSTDALTKEHKKAQLRQRTKYPYPTVLQLLIVAYLDAKQFQLAMAHAAVQVFDIDPKIYKAEFHPLRITHLYLLIRLMTLIVTDPHYNRDDQVLDLTRYKLNLEWWRARLVAELVKHAEKTFTEGQVLQAFRYQKSLTIGRHRFLPEDLNNSVVYEVQWARMRKLIDDMYQVFAKTTGLGKEG